MCVCVCMYVCIYVCVCVCICMYACMYTCIHKHARTHTRTHTLSLSFTQTDINIQGSPVLVLTKCGSGSSARSRIGASTPFWLLLKSKLG